MRSVPSGSFARLTRVENLWHAWRAYARGKRRRPPVAAFDIDADRHVFRIHRQLRGEQYQPGPYHVTVIRDPKTRVVAAPSMADRVVQRALLDDIRPTYERSFIDHSYAVLSGRGTHRAVLRYLGWTRQYRYRLSLDIRRYFLSIHCETLLGLFAHHLRDTRTLALIADMLAAGSHVYRQPAAIHALKLDNDPVPAGCGLPLGGYLSHWSGGLYLDSLDRFIKRVLKIGGYLRYMDDVALFSDDRKQLESARVEIGHWLMEQRRLSLNPKGQQVRPTREPSTYLGHRVSRSGLTLGPKTKKRIRERMRAAAMGQISASELERSLRSMQGLVRLL